MVSRLNKGRILQPPTMAPVKITIADIRSNFSKWQLYTQGRVVFVVALAH
jgi:hypothetical protein